MASQDNLLSRIGALVAGFDDASWEALASKGLLRRARKDIEKGLEIEILAAGPEALQIKVLPFLVSIPPSGPAKATCTCPAPGVCQHILAAGLYLQSRAVDSEEQKVGPTADSIRQEITLITAERLKTWAGSTDYRAGVSLLEKNSSPPVVSYEETVVVRLLPSGVEARFVPGGDLDGMIVPKPHGKRVAVATMLALRKSLGLEIPEAAAQQVLVEITGTPRTQKEILDSACSVLEDAIAVGLSHVSGVFPDRLVTLAVSAQGANLPRVSLALKSVADEVKSILHREARADEARLLLLMARVYALMDAIRSSADSPRLELAGTPRGQYVEVPEIELSGVGAYTWHTGSDYRGLTVLFWSNQTKEFLSWSETRPEAPQFDPRQRFYAEGPWDGTQSPQQVAASHFRLRNARRTSFGRLSSSTKTSALVLGPTAPVTLDFGDRIFTSWSVMRRYVYQKQPLGLREPNPLELVGVLSPVTFGPREFDSVTQTFTWEVYDERNQMLMLSLPFRDWSKEAIRILEALSPDGQSRWHVVARFALRDEQLLVEPISILRPDDQERPVFQLSFDVLTGQATAGNLVDPGTPDESPEEALDAEDNELEPSEIGGPARTYLNRRLTEMNRRFQAMAEAGVKSGVKGHREWCEKSRDEAHASGLTMLARVLKELSQPSAPTPTALLKARYLTHLHGQAISHVFEK